MPADELDRPLIEVGIKCLAAGGDFADGVITAEAMRARPDQLPSFDQALAKFPNKVRLLAD
jgi:hypothetical protein